MPIVITKEFNMEGTRFADFIVDFHGAIVGNIRKFHSRLGVIGFVDPHPWEWSIVRVNNQMQQSIEILMCVNKLWVYGYRCVVADGQPQNPWLLTDGYKDDGFSGLEGRIKTLFFNGKYERFMQKMDISKQSFNNSVSVLYKYGEKLKKLKGDQRPNPPEIERAQRSFLMMVLYFCEALRILPIRSIIELAFDSEMSIFIGGDNYHLAKNWSSISNAFFKQDYSMTTEDCGISNEEKAREIVALLLYSSTNGSVLDNVPPLDFVADGGK